MSLRSSVVRVGFSLLLVVSLSVLAFADTIRLKDGSIIKGRIVGFSGGKFTISIGEGSRLRELTFYANEVESIVFDSAGDKPQNTAADKPIKDGGKIVNTSSTTSDQPRVVITDPMVRTNGKATIGSTSPGPRKSGGTEKKPEIKDTSSDSQQPVGVPSVPGTSNSGGKADPISWTVKVTADNTSNGWTNSGWVVKKGQRIHIVGDGQVSLGKGKMSPPSGLGDLQDEQKLLKSVPTGALIAVIGDDNNDFIYVGAEREFTATRDGALFLGINEGNLDDNSGTFSVKIEIYPENGK